MSRIQNRHVLLGLGAAALALLVWFRPAPPTAAARPLKVVFFTDVHARTEWDTPRALAQAADAINAQQADLVLCGGDMITDGYDSSPAMAAPCWETYRAMHEAIRPEPIAVIGNHDLVGVAPADGSPPVADPRAEVRARMGLPQTYRSFDQGGFHFILLTASSSLRTSSSTGDSSVRNRWIGCGPIWPW